MQKEIWKDVDGFNCAYQVSNHGRIKSVDRIVGGCCSSTKTIRGVIFKQTLMSGYARINFSKNRKRYYLFVHRLVGKAFIDNPENKPPVNH